MRRVEGARVGPGSLLWEYASDGRAMLTGMSAGLLQLMHPSIGAGVAEYSAFFDDPWRRILRSVPQIWATIFAEDEAVGEARGRAIRDLHIAFNGKDSCGRRYRALDPAVFWWAHATFTWELLTAADMFWNTPLSCEARGRLYAETVTWYRRYGVDDYVVPEDVQAFDIEFHRMCTEVLDSTPAAMQAIEMAERRRTPRVILRRLTPRLAPAAPAISRLGGEVLRLLALGGLPEVSRDRCEIAWSVSDRAAYSMLVLSIRTSGRIVPRRSFDWLIPPNTPVAPAV